MARTGGPRRTGEREELRHESGCRRGAHAKACMAAAILAKQAGQSALLGGAEDLGSVKKTVRTSMCAPLRSENYVKAYYSEALKSCNAVQARYAPLHVCLRGTPREGDGAPGTPAMREEYDTKPHV